MNPLYYLLARLIRESPSMQAAMKAGKRTQISARVKRAGASHWDDLGTLHTRQEWWRGTFLALPLGAIHIIYKIAGKDYPGD